MQLKTDEKGETGREIGRWGQVLWGLLGPEGGSPCWLLHGWATQPEYSFSELAWLTCKGTRPQPEQQVVPAGCSDKK